MTSEVSSTRNPTLIDIMKGMDPDSGVAVVAEILNETNDIHMDMVMMESNLPMGHQSSVRTGLPEPSFRQMYGFAQPTKGTVVPVTDTIAMLPDYAEVDKAAADLNGNTSQYRVTEDRAHIEGMNIKMATTLFEGNDKVNPTEFTGFNARFNDLAAENAANIIDAGGLNSDNASIWLVGWGENSCFSIYPKGMQAGLNFQDLGEVTLVNSTGGMMQGYRSYYEWKMGLVVKDWRFVVRIANIDRSLLSADASTGANLPDLMFEAAERAEGLGTARYAWYMDRTLITKVRQQSAKGVAQSTLTVEEVGGVKRKSFELVPMQRTDALAVDEARVV